MPSPQLIVFTDQNLILIHDLLDQSKQEGYEFVQRTIDDWTSGTNNFSAAGEKLWGLVLDAKLVGIGGLNRAPYTDDTETGRVRHLYISKPHRRKGYATLLMNAIIDHARIHFTIIRLFTANPAAGKFYEALGFQKVNGYKVSHAMTFPN